MIEAGYDNGNSVLVRLTRFIARRLSSHLLVVVDSTLHVLTLLNVWFSGSNIFVRPPMFACSSSCFWCSSCTLLLFPSSIFVWCSMVAKSCFFFSPSSCTVRLFASSVFVWTSIVVWNCFCFSRSSCIVRLFASSVFVWTSIVVWGCFCFSRSSCTVRLFAFSVFVRPSMEQASLCYSVKLHLFLLFA
jgi:hypothetical protein